MKPLASLGHYRIVVGDELGLDVVDALVTAPVPYLVIRRVTENNVFWDVIDVDDELFSHLSRPSPIAGLLDLSRSAGNHAVRLVELLSKKRRTFDGATRTDRIVVDSGGTARALVGHQGLVEVSTAVYPSLSTGARSVEPNQTIELALALKSRPPEGIAALLDLHFEEGEEFVPVHASVSSNAFTRPEGTVWSTEFKVARDLSSTPTVWNFKARTQDDRDRYTLNVSFVARGVLLGNVVVTLPRTDNLALTASISPSGPLVLPQPEENSGLTLCISEQGTTFRSMTVLHRGVPIVQDARWEIAADPGYFGELQRARDVQAVEDIGVGLWADLPGAVRDLLSGEAHNNDSPLVIIGATPYAPFEAALLPNDGELLGVRRPILRWVSDVTQPQTTLMPVREVLCIRPTYGGADHLPSAIEEETYLADSLPALHRAGTEASLRPFLDNADVGAIHFAGHAQTNPPQLKLEGGVSIRPAFFRPNSPLMAKGKPFLFVNGCHAGTGRVGAPTAQGNMVKALLVNRATSVIAPALEVLSEAARDVARTFYSRVAAGETVGAAMRHVRHHARAALPDQVGSYLSYLAFASPSLRLSWPA